MRRIVALLFCLTFLLPSTMGVASAAEPYNGVLQYLPMTYNPDSVRLMNNSWLDAANGWPINDSTLIADGANTAGINGTPALVVKYTDGSINDNNQRGDRVLMSSSNNRWENAKYSHDQTAGYVYFQSAMMKLDREAGFWIYGSFQHTHSGTINGFNVPATDFAAEKAKYDALGADEKTTMSNYAMTGGMELSTSWYRYNTAYYIDTMIDEGGAPATSIPGTLRVATGIAAGTRTGITPETPLGVLIDDYVMIKVPANDLAAEVYPMAGNIEISGGELELGNKLTANANAYDVNPMVTPSVAYQWQRSADGEEYTDISGATGDSYTVTSDDLGGKLVRVKVTVSSERSDKTVKSSEHFSTPVRAPERPVVNNVTLEGITMVNKELTAKALITDITGIVKAAKYKWQVSADNKSWSDITGASGDKFIPSATYADKYIRAGVWVESDKFGASDPVYSDSVKIVPDEPLPVAKNVKVTVSGKNASVVYDYEGSSSESGSGIAWEISASGADGWTGLDVTGEKITLSYANIGKYLRAVITPVNQKGIKGEPAYSEAAYIEPFIQGDVELYVSSDGNDSNDGSIDAPLATLAKAQQEVRGLVANGFRVNVNIRGGEYFIDETLQFTSQDSGTDDAPVVWKAYNGEKVTFTGGKKIPEQYITEVTDTKVLNAVKSSIARKGLLEIDLSSMIDGDMPQWYTDPSNSNDDVYQVFYNGQSLKMARWPKNDEDNVYVDSKTDDTVFTYTDPAAVTAGWSFNNSDIMVQGHLNATYFWHLLNVNSLSGAERTVTIDNPNAQIIGTGTDYSFYFCNVLEEISEPGECHVDFAGKKVYFAPFYNMDKSELYLPVSDKAMLNVTDASNIVFEGLDFRYVRNSFFTVGSQTRGIVFDGCTFVGGTGANTLSGNGNTVKGCRFYDTGRISLIGGGAFTGGGNTVENCSIECKSNFKGQGNGIESYGYNHKITNNDIYNSNGCLIQLGWGSVDTYIGFNNLHHGAQNAGDWGAIYWGRAVHSIGIEIDNNYFHHNSSKYHKGWSQSLFCDDGSVGPYIHDNVFYRATLAPDEGGTMYPLKTYGGQYMNIENNMFIENPTACLFQQYWPDGWKGWYLGCLNKNAVISETSNNWLGYLKSSGYFDGTKWQDHYKGTQWEGFTKLFTQEILDEVSKYDKNDPEDYKKLLEIAEKNYSEKQNWFTNNLLVNQGNMNAGMYGGSNGVEKGTVAVRDKSMFVDYGTDFELTEEGISSVQKQNPDFRNIDMSKIGPVDFSLSAPEVKSLMVTGNNAAGGTVSAVYTVTDADGHKEGGTVYQWYVGTKADGKYTPVDGATNYSFVIPESMEGCYIKCEVTPADETHMLGEAVMSEPVGIASAGEADKTSLRAAVADALSVLESAQIGTDDGCYPESAAEALRTEIASAQNVINEIGVSAYVISATETKLRNAIDAFHAEKIMNIRYMSIKTALADTEGWTTHSGEKPSFADGGMVVDANSMVSYALPDNCVYVFKMKLNEEGDPSTAIGIRVEKPENEIWVDNNGYLLWIHDTSVECQKWTPQNIESKTNDVLANNTEYMVALGVYDLENGNVRYICEVDGNTVFDKEFAGENLHGKSGGFVIRSGNADVVLAPADVDTAELSAAVKSAKDVLNGAAVGDNYGEYKSTDSLKTAIAVAEGVLSDTASVQSDVDKAVVKLKNSVNVFELSANTAGSASSDKVFRLNYKLGDADFTAVNNAKIELVIEPGKAVPGITADASGVSVTIPEGTVFTENTVVLPYGADVPSGSVIGKNPKKVYAMGGGTVNNPVRIVISGEGNTRVAYLNRSNGYKEITARLKEDSFDAAKAALVGNVKAVKYTAGSDLVIYTYEYVELMTFYPVDDEPDVPSAPSGGSGGVGGGGSSSSGSNVTYNYSEIGGGSATQPSVKDRFIDIVGHWAEKDINEMADKGIISGVTENTFEPDRNITRAEFATLIVKALNLAGNTAEDFADVDSTAWYFTTVKAAASAGIIVGSDGMFRPGDSITREEMAVILVKAMEYIQKSSEGTAKEFTDADSVSDWAKPYVEKATAAGLISGMTDGSFAPKANATRAQAASVIKRLLTM